MTPMERAIVAKCLECKAFNFNSVRLCRNEKCPLHKFSRIKKEETKNGNSETR